MSESLTADQGLWEELSRILVLQAVTLHGVAFLLGVPGVLEDVRLLPATTCSR